MKKIITFEKELLFKTSVCKVTSISLEHKTKMIADDLISGVFYISGDYKMTEGSINREKFDYNIPFDIALDSRYDINNMVIDIDDFRYKIVNDEILKVRIDLFIDGDKLEDKEIEVIKVDIDDSNDIINTNTNNIEIQDNVELEDRSNINTSIKEEKKLPMPEIDKEDITSNEKERGIDILFDNDKKDTYATYHVYIVKEEDTIDTIMTKYEVSKEILDLYNEINQINPGDKIIIPAKFNE